MGNRQQEQKRNCQYGKNGSPEPGLSLESGLAQAGHHVLSVSAGKD